METRSIAAAANAVVPAILALEAGGFRVFREDGLVVAVAGPDRYVAEDPVLLLGLIKLAEIRGWSWRSSDEEVDEVLNRFGWTDERRQDARCSTT